MCPTCPAARTVTVTKSCWGEVPELPLNPEDIGKVIKPEQIAALAASFVLLVNYVADRRAKCGGTP